MDNAGENQALPRSVTTTAGAPINATFHCSVTITRGSRSYPEAGAIPKGRRASGVIMIVKADHVEVTGAVPRYLMMVAGRKRTLCVNREYNLHQGDPTRNVRIRIDAMERLS